MKGRKRPFSVTTILFNETPLLPEHIIFEIFARLPVTVLFKFRCVSKFCRSLMSDPLFIASHCCRSGSPTYLISYSTTLQQRQHVFHCLNPNGVVTEHFRDLGYDSYAKSINGFMCLLRQKQIMIRNLVSNNQLVLPYFHTRNRYDHKHYVHFCYCLKMNKYKVLVASSTRNRHNVSSMRYSVFTLGVDNSWRGLDHLGLYQLGKSKSICVDGVLYCTNFSTTTNVENGVIAIFRVEREEFGVITYPDELSWRRYNLCNLIEVKGVIAIIDIEGLEGCVIKMWIRETGLNSHECWIKNTILLPSQCINIYDHNFSFTTNRNGEIVLAYCGMLASKCWILVYNMEKREWTSVEVLGLRRCVILEDFLIEDYVEPWLGVCSSPF